MEGGRRTESLRDVEQRLKRALELRGAQDLDLGQVVVPVVIAHDATGPGWREQIERAWAHSEIILAGGNLAKLAIKADTRPVAIDQVSVSVSAVTGVRFGILGPKTADPWAINNVSIRWIERMQGTDEVTGILTEPQNTDFAIVGTEIWNHTLLANTPIIVNTLGIVLEPGGKLIVQATDAGGADLRVSMRGRVL